MPHFPVWPAFRFLMCMPPLQLLHSSLGHDGVEQSQKTSQLVDRFHLTLKLSKLRLVPLRKRCIRHFASRIRGSDFKFPHRHHRRPIQTKASTRAGAQVAGLQQCKWALARPRKKDVGAVGESLLTSQILVVCAPSLLGFRLATSTGLDLDAPGPARKRHKKKVWSCGNPSCLVRSPLPQDVVQTDHSP